ncbi:hypothetical protein [Sinorhizobium medicae]
MRWWRKSLAAQFICFLLMALVLSQVIGFLISWDERDKALRAASKGEFLSRTASLAALLEFDSAEFPYGRPARKRYDLHAFLDVRARSRRYHRLA